MNPSNLADALRRIASKIDASKSPSKNLVLADIRRLVLAMDPNVDVPGDDQQVDPEQDAYGAALETEQLIDPETGEVVQGSGSLRSNFPEPHEFEMALTDDENKYGGKYYGA